MLSNAADDSATALTQAFAPATTDYTASVANAVDRVTVAATATHGSATVAYLDDSENTLEDAEDTKPGQQVALAVGATIIKVRVTAEDGATTQIYKITVTRAVSTETRTGRISTDATLSNLTLSVGALGPSFSPEQTSYTATVGQDEFRVTVTPVTSHPKSTVAYLDASDATLTDADADTATFEADITQVDNVVKVQVTAEDGITEKTYVVRFTRQVLRLVGGEADHEGRLEILHDGEWGTICDDYWTDTEADLACRILGYPEGSVGDTGRFSAAYFGAGKGPIWLDNLLCTGSETSLLDCPRQGSPAIGEHNCNHREDQGVRCETVTVPRVESIEVSAPSRGTYDPGETLEVTLVWSEPVDVETPAGGKPPKLWVGFEIGQEVLVEYASGSGTTRTVFARTVPQLVPNGRTQNYARVQVFRNSLRVRDGAITKADSEVEAELAHPRYPDTALQVAAPGIVEAPTISEAGADGAWDPGATVEVRLTFSREVVVDTGGGTPSVGLLLGGVQERRAAYASGSGSTVLVFGYTLTEADGSHNAMLVSSDSLTLHGGAIRDRATGLDAELAHDGGGLTAPALPESLQEDAPPGLTASFTSAPPEHDGSNPFELRLEFSEEPHGMSYRTVHEHLFDVENASIKRAARASPPRNLRYMLTVVPSGNSAVELAGRPSGLAACGEAHSICTSDGRALEGAFEARIPGPVAIEAHDASVREGPGAVLSFRITLDRARHAAVSVNYATADGTATEGEDYTSASGTLTFAAGETGKTVEVAVLDDSHDEGGETLTLTVSNPSGARIERASATGTIENSDPIPREWMVRFGRTVGSQVLEALGARLEGGERRHVTVAGIALTDEAPALPEAVEDDPFAFPGWARTGAFEEPSRTITGDDLRLGSSFRLSSASPEDPHTASFTTWGRSARGGFDAQADGVRIDGDVTTTVIGADAAWGAMLAGVMLSQSTGEGGYRATGSETEGDSGRVKSHLAGVYPYGRAELGGGLSVWGLMGAGRGRIEVRPGGRDDAAPTIETDLDLRMGAVGTRGRVLDGSGPSGVALEVKSDAMWVATESARTGEMIATEGDVGRLRLVVAGERRFEAQGGAELVPSAEVGLRHDAGDAETGTAVELGAGVRYTCGRLGIDARARTLLAHEDDNYREWGASAGVFYAAMASGSGLSLSLRPRWGRAESATRRLWSAANGTEIARGETDEPMSRLDAEVGYGLTLARSRGMLTPYGAMSLAGSTSRTMRAGVRWTLRSELAVGLEATRQESTGEGANELRLRAALRF